jgi:hypothetical protein
VYKVGVTNKGPSATETAILVDTTAIYNHWFLESLVYPTLANGVDAVSANADWTFGAYVTVVPINTITNRYHIHHVIVEALDRDAVFELALYQGAADDIVASIRLAQNGGFFGNTVYAIRSEEIAANAQIRARLASSNGAAQIATARISVGYVEEPL